MIKKKSIRQCLAKKIMCVILITCITCLCACYVPQNSSDSYSDKVQAAIGMNLLVHNMLNYGDDVSDNINDVLADGTGHCGDYSFLLAYMLKEKGYNVERVALRSFYAFAVHTVVECNINGYYFVFDPTDGVYYKNSIEELLSDPELSNNHILQVDENECLYSYVCEDFWRGMRCVERYNSLISTNSTTASFIQTDYYNRIEETSVLGLSFNGKAFDIDPLLDGYVNSYLQIEGEQKNEIIIALENNNYSMVCVNFCFNDYSLQDASISVHDTEKDEWIQVDSFDRFGSFYEIYLNDYKIDALKINGSNSSTGEIVISDILVTEKIRYKVEE